MKLSEQQRKFTYMVGQLIAWAYANRYELTVGEAYRTPEQAQLNAKQRKEIAYSLHTQRLAIDLNLFLQGEYQTDSAASKPLSEFWESIGSSWGGRLNKPVGNHFSLGYQGGSNT
ncbi:M15 family metallopeptidase [Pantoea sp.]|uniref:M15 family metallopeptidase n=1 Tax=Pantoea sp. TaxID=69393 RepID=UPI00289FC79D|nr:M15 family metallopeptidase [Pantoea sp.]